MDNTRAAHSTVNHAGIAPSDRLRILVLGYIVRGPLGGMAWSDMHYLAGLRALGHDVYFFEDSGDSPWCCYDPAQGKTDSDPSYGLEFASRALESIGMGSRWAYYDAHRSRWNGPCVGQARQICAGTDVLLNMYGADKLHPWMTEIPVRVLIDKDPVFTQVRHLTDPVVRAAAEEHTVFFTFGENFGKEGTTMPADGLDWQVTRHPIHLEAWPAHAEGSNGKFTTVMLWDSYQVVEYAGRSYSMKSESFRPYINLPSLTRQVLELAAGSPTVPRQLLSENGWRLADPLAVTKDPQSYHDYIRSSKAEFTVAKHGYAASRCGWFSERSAAYLASGRPVVTQETGFSDWLPSGSGVIAFTNPDEALAGIEDIHSHYTQHCRAAREIAEAYFDSRKVLEQLIGRALTPRSASAQNTTTNSPRVPPRENHVIFQGE